MDFRVLCQSRSPGEVNDVAVSIVDKIIQITSTNSSSSQNAANDAANPSSNLKVGGPETSSGELRPYSNSCIAAKDSLSADDLIPLIGFAFALYFQSLRVSASNPSVRTHNFRGTDRELVSID